MAIMFHLASQGGPSHITPGLIVYYASLATGDYRYRAQLDQAIFNNERRNEMFDLLTDDDPDTTYLPELVLSLHYYHKVLQNKLLLRRAARDIVANARDVIASDEHARLFNEALDRALSVE